MDCFVLSTDENAFLEKWYKTLDTDISQSEEGDFRYFFRDGIMVQVEIKNQDRRIYDFYRLLVLLKRDQERYNFLKFFNINHKTNLVKTLHENHVFLNQPKSKNQQTIIHLDYYGMLQCIQYLKHNNKLKDTELRNLNGLEEFLSDMEDLNASVYNYYDAEMGPFANFPGLEKDLAVENYGRGCYLLLLGITNGLLSIMIGKSSDLPKRIAQHKRRYYNLKLLIAARNNDELSLERKIKQILELHGATLLNSISSETYIVTSKFMINDFINCFKQATMEVNGSELLEALSPETPETPETLSTPGKCGKCLCWESNSGHTLFETTRLYNRFYNTR